MTKRAAIVRAVALGLGLIAIVIGVDAVLVRTSDLAWLAWVIDVAAVVLICLFAWGMFGASSPLFGGVVNGRRIREPVIALTFDDGPSPDVTPRILDTLRREGVRATFFVLGKHAERHPELIARMVREGHEVANHGYDHGILAFAGPNEIHRQIHRTQRIVERAGAPRPRSFRAPHGFRSPYVTRTARRLGYRTCAWSKGVFDTSKPGTATIVKRSVAALKPGAVLLLHDADGWGDDDRTQTAEALPAIIDAARHRGYGFVTMEEVARLDPPVPISWRRLILIISVIGLVTTLALARVDRSEVDTVLAAFAGLSIPLVIAATLANFVSIAMRATIWKASLATVPGVRAGYRAIFPALFIGYLLNTVLIARAGEIGRVVVLRRRLQREGQPASVPTLTVTVVMEQLVSGAALVALLIAIVFAIDGMPDWAARGVLILIGVIVAALLGLIVLELVSRWRLRRGEAHEDYARTWWRETLRTVEIHLHAASEGLQLLRRPGLAIGSFVAGILSWIAQIVAIWLTLAAFGIDEDRLAAACVVFLVSNLVGFLPLVPGNVGVFQLAVATALSQAFGIGFGQAVTFAIGLQVIEVALGAGVGFIFLWLEGLSIGDMRRTITRAEEEQEAARRTPPPAVADVRSGALRA